MGTDHLFKGTSLHSTDPLTMVGGGPGGAEQQAHRHSELSQSGSWWRWGAVELTL